MPNKTTKSTRLTVQAVRTSDYFCVFNRVKIHNPHEVFSRVRIHVKQYTANLKDEYIFSPHMPFRLFDVALVSSRQLPVGSVSSAPPHTVHVRMFIVHCSAHRSLPQRDRICVLCIFRCYGSARALVSVFVSQWPIWRSPCEPR